MADDRVEIVHDFYREMCDIMWFRLDNISHKGFEVVDSKINALADKIAKIIQKLVDKEIYVAYLDMKDVCYSKMTVDSIDFFDNASSNTVFFKNELSELELVRCINVLMIKVAEV